MIVDKYGRKPENIFVYAGNIIDQIEEGSYSDSFKKAVDGRFPMDGDRYLVEEFSHFVGEEAFKETNFNYQGQQVVHKVNNPDEIWWVYYVPMERLESFNRIDKYTNSAGIVKHVLTHNGFKLAQTRNEISAMEYNRFAIYKDLGSEKIIIHRYPHIDRKNDRISVSAIDVLMPTMLDKTGFTTVETENLFFRTRSEDGTCRYSVSWDEAIGMNIDDDTDEFCKYIQRKYLGIKSFAKCDNSELSSAYGNTASQLLGKYKLCTHRYPSGESSINSVLRCELCGERFNLSYPLDNARSIDYTDKFDAVTDMMRDK